MPCEELRLMQVADVKTSLLILFGERLVLHSLEKAQEDVLWALR